jgi:hypothetical protein
MYVCRVEEGRIENQIGRQGQSENNRRKTQIRCAGHRPMTQGGTVQRTIHEAILVAR